MILDAGVLIAVERDEPQAKDFVEAARLEGEPLRTTAPVLAQVWRGGARQALLARFAQTMEVHPFMPEDVSRVGRLLHDSGASDVVDAHLLVRAMVMGDSVLTADVSDFLHLAGSLGLSAPRIRHWR